MGATSFYGLPYPDAASTVDVPRDVKALADKLELWKNGITVPNGHMMVGDPTTPNGWAFKVRRIVSGTAKEDAFRCAGQAAAVTTYSAGATMSELLVWEDGRVTVEVAGNGTVRPMPFAMQVGTAVVAVTASITGSVAVNLTGGRFTQPPMVVTTSVSSTSYVATPTSISTTGFTANVRQIDATSSTTSVTVHWMAVQMLPATAPG
jgi:hypothetical protein